MHTMTEADACKAAYAGEYDRAATRLQFELTAQGFPDLADRLTQIAPEEVRDRGRTAFGVELSFMWVDRPDLPMKHERLSTALEFLYRAGAEARHGNHSYALVLLSHCHSVTGQAARGMYEGLDRDYAPALTRIDIDLNGTDSLPAGSVVIVGRREGEPAVGFRQGYTVTLQPGDYTVIENALPSEDEDFPR